MDRKLKALEFVRVYLDDFLIFSKNEEEHMEHLWVVIKLIAKSHLKFKIKKCSFMQRRIELLVHYIDLQGVHVNPKKISAINEFPPPRSATELRSFLCLAGYYRRFIAGFVDISAVLHAGTPVKEKTFKWT